MRQRRAKNNQVLVPVVTLSHQTQMVESSQRIIRATYNLKHVTQSPVAAVTARYNLFWNFTKSFFLFHSYAKEKTSTHVICMHMQRGRAVIGRKIWPFMVLWCVSIKLTGGQHADCKAKTLYHCKLACFEWRDLSAETTGRWCMWHITHLLVWSGEMRLFAERWFWITFTVEK